MKYIDIGDLNMRRNMRNRMSRRRFLGSAAAGVGAAMVGTGVVHADRGDSDHIDVVSPSHIEVYPLPSQSTKPPIDIKNVQWAVDNIQPVSNEIPGTVVLKKNDINGNPNTFNFGSDGSIKITRDGPVKIIGEGNRETTIEGGFGTFEVHHPAEVTIQNINFSNATMAAVVVRSCVAAKIEDNTIVMGFPGLIGTFPLPPSLIGVFVNNSGPFGTNVYGPMGDVEITDNTIDCFPGLGPEGVGAVQHFYSAGILTISNAPAGSATLLIEGNTIDNPGHAGVHIGGSPAFEQVTVQENTITQQPTSYYKFYTANPTDAGIPLRAGEGMRFLSAAFYGGENKQVDVIDNTINNVSTSGITVRDYQGVENTYYMNMNDNTIRMANAISGSSGIYIGFIPHGPPPGGLFGKGMGSELVSGVNNTILGQADYGFYVIGGALGYSHDNIIEGTLLSKNSEVFTPTEAHVYFHGNTHDNTIEFTGVDCDDLDIEDNGTDNVVADDSNDCP
jgi:hypothetical protein